jgi:hypothetical protein
MFNQVRFCLRPQKKEGLIMIDSVKVYTIVKEDEMGKPKKEMVEKLDDTQIILGHTCTKYKIWQDDSVYKNTYYVWVANDMLITNPGVMSEVGGEAFVKTLPYAVLKMETIAGLHYEVTSISTQKPDPGLFKTPKGYRLEKKLFRKADEKEKKKK